jgi:hypothetical protein
MMQHVLEPVGTLQALDEADQFLVQDQLGDALGTAIGRQHGLVGAGMNCRLR